MQYRFTSAALTELRQAILYYEQRKNGLDSHNIRDGLTTRSGEMEGSVVGFVVINKLTTTLAAPSLARSAKSD